MNISETKVEALYRELSDAISDWVRAEIKLNEAQEIYLKANERRIAARRAITKATGQPL